jgi:hypothetical protein
MPKRANTTQPVLRCVGRGTISVRYGVVLLIILVVVASGSTATTGQRATIPTRHQISNQPSLAISFSNPIQNGSMPHHRNPQKVDHENSSNGVSWWVSGELSRQLSSSVQQVKKGDYKYAKRLVGHNSKYSKLAKRYSNDSDTMRNGTSRSKYRQLQRNQRQFAGSVQSYRTTLEKYRDEKRAHNKRAHNASRVRELARELNRYSNQVKRNGTSLKRNIKGLSSNDSMVTNSTRSINSVVKNISQRQTKIRKREFVETRMTELTVSSTGSFRNPFTITGRLTTANGSELSDEPIALRMGNHTVQAQTDSVGRFVVDYRPTLLEAGTKPRTIEYIPRNDTVYRSTKRRVNVTVEQIKPRVELKRPRHSVGYHENLTITGSVGTANNGAPNVPVVATVDGVRIGATRTSSNGSYTISRQLPSTVASGQNRVRVRVRLTDRALSKTATTKPITIAKTGTNLSTNVTRNGNRIRVEGAFSTSNGDPVRNETLEIRLAGRTITTAQTNSTGNFSAVTTVPKDLVGKKSVAKIAVVYSGSKTNLQSAKSQSDVHFATKSSKRTNWFLWVAGIGLLGLIAGSVYLLRSPNLFGRTSTPVVDLPPENSTDKSKWDLYTGDVDSADELIVRAREQLNENRPDVAVQIAYIAVRWELLERNQEIQYVKATHWEVYDAYRPDDTDSRDTLKRVTRAYEMAAFSATPLSPADARTAVDAAASFVSSSDGE